MPNFFSDDPGAPINPVNTQDLMRDFCQFVISCSMFSGAQPPLEKRTKKDKKRCNEEECKAGSKTRPRLTSKL